MKNNGNRRQRYLLKTLGLSHDPFDGPVAEQELHSSEKEPHFFAYYVDPHPPETGKPLPQLLREARTGLIFGSPGSGKTTLRYTLEAECRAVYDRTLIVTYELSHKLTQPPTTEMHWANIAAELAIDLFIQAIEQLNVLGPPTEVQKRHLREQIANVWPRLRRTVDLILSEDFSDRENGLAALWPRLNRPAVRNINPSPQIFNLIKDCLPEGSHSLKTSSGRALLRAGVAAAKAWGFEQIFVLVDGVDAQARQVGQMLALITPLLDNLARWQAKDLFFYFFLPSEMQGPVSNNYREKFSTLSFPPIWHIINWNERALSELLRQRLRATGSRIPGFNALAASEFKHGLEDPLIKAAYNSPRQLLRVVSALIDAHAQNEPEQLLITLRDWHDMQRRWSYGPPLPPDLMVSADSLNISGRDSEEGTMKPDPLAQNPGMLKDAPD